MQLATAIEMWFNDDNPVAVHTLACAAHQIIHDLNRQKKGPPLLLDSDFIKPEFRKEAVALLKKPSGFFKHADFRKNRDPQIEFDPRLSEGFLLFSLAGLRYLGHKFNAYEFTFFSWALIHRPQYLSDKGRKLFSENFTVEHVEFIRKASKQEFFEKVFERYHQ